MQLAFHGAARTVTGSRHLLTVNGKRILLDCGLYQGKRAESYEKNLEFPFDPASIDVLVLSHAHIDHSGNIPNLVKNGFKGDIVATYASRDLCTIMLRDSARIQQYDVEYVNKKRAKEGLPPVEPLYTVEDSIDSLRYFLAIGYERSREIAPGVHLTFYDAGHILGSAMVALDIEDHESKQDVRLVFSGDIGRPNRPILRDPTFIKEADILICESTYGNRFHPANEDTDDTLADIINRTSKRGGRLIMPAFAVGRTQELVYRIHQLVLAERINDQLPVYVDSPLAIDATGIYRLHPEAYDEELETFMLENGADPFGFDTMRYTRTVSQSKALNDDPEPSVIISASGMAEAGRILHHLKNNVEDPRNTILITGWQAPQTLGRRIVEKQPRVKIFGEEYNLRAEVAVLNGLSGHADRGELLEWADHISERPKHTYIVHGEPDASFAFADGLRELGYPEVTVPEMDQQFTL
ncbi:MAG: MBL fold metallo-hydrolase [Anaerolineales bacterium]|nr:MBL fold metallo-hydrolase [Anaerolineales bacterium]MCB0010311.1 MBL fold metallo-hydrolase [Anaerolineales bacterium]MCB8961051.1 MBL fold metallo-hydrolase [Ardenticatenales bacterium]